MIKTWQVASIKILYRQIFEYKQIILFQLGETKFEMMTQEQELLDKLINVNSQAELFSRVFLKPIEIALKTSDNEQDQKKRIQKLNCLPYGLKQAVKLDIYDNRHKLVEFYPLQLTQQTQFSNVQENNLDNMISLLKGVNNQRMKLLICICMYNEDKGMLRRTLSGVKDNIAELVKTGISSHQIGVCVVMDGIEAMDSSILDYIEELQKESGVYLTNDVQSTDIHEIYQTGEINLDDHEVININKYIFAEEYEDRQKRQFTWRYNQYKEVKKIIKRIEELEKDKTVTFDSLDKTMQKYFYEVAKAKHKQLYGDLPPNQTPEQQCEMLKEKYATNLAISRPLIRQALSVAKRNSQEYIKTRDSLALLNCFRVSIPLQFGVTFERQQNYDALGDDQRQQTKMNLFFITKYKNRGKLSSHNWFLNGICNELNPKYSVLLDVGLAPEKDSLYKMIMYMEKHTQVGGVCGYMGLKIERVDHKEQVAEENIDCITNFCMKLVDIQRAQQMEYHFAHLIDKPFQSSFDFIHVLPGAFSAYRMEALKPTHSEQLLKEYFSSILDNSIIKAVQKTEYSTSQAIFKVLLPDPVFDCFWPVDQKTDESLLYKQNVYLAEDRTLCLGIYLNGYSLQYLPDAYAWVDPVKTLYGLLGQRKRWINGSFFAFNSVKAQLKESNQGSCFLGLQIFYLTFMNMLAFIAPALFLFTIHIAMYAFYADVLVPVVFTNILNVQTDAQLNFVQQGVVIFVHTIDFLYVMVFLGLIFYSMHLTNRVAKFQSFLYGASTAYGIISVIVFVILTYDIINGLINSSGFLIENEDFLKNLVPPASDSQADIQAAQNTAQLLVDILRYIIIGTMGLYAIPILVNMMLFCRGDVLIDIIFSSFSFMFFGSTYLNILNIYALCRIDDISWGTKGLDTGVSGGAKERQDSWKKIKIVHVVKLVFYNGVAGFILLFLGNDYQTRFYITFVIMILLAFTMLVKVILAIVYLVGYKCCKRIDPIRNTSADRDQINNTYNRISPSLKRNIKENIENAIREQMQNNQQTFNNLNNNQSIIMIRALSKIQPKKDRRKKMDLFNSRISKDPIKPVNKKSKLKEPMEQPKLKESSPAKKQNPKLKPILTPIKQKPQVHKNEEDSSYGMSIQSGGSEEKFGGPVKITDSKIQKSKVSHKKKSII